jgi:tRNA(fMet)-specific endonuclease VapC
MTADPLLSLPALLDTDIFSEFLRGRNATVARRAAVYETVRAHFTVSAVTLVEVVSGWQRRGLHARVDELLACLVGWTVLAVDGDVTTLARRMHGDLLRTGQPTGVADPLIAATALHHNLVLVTGNTAHDQRLQALGYDLRLDDWRVG